MDIIKNVGDTHIRAFSEPIMDGVQIYITGKNLATGKRVYAPSVDFVEVDDLGVSIRPTLMLPFHITNAIQILMDASGISVFGQPKELEVLEQ